MARPGRKARMLSSSRACSEPRESHIKGKQLPTQYQGGFGQQDQSQNTMLVTRCRFTLQIRSSGFL